MSKDLLDERFGRFFEIPEHLAQLGHQVTGLTAAYHRRIRQSGAHFDGAPRTQWTAVDLMPFPLAGLVRYWCTLKRIIKLTRPEVVIGCSDAYHAILAQYVARTCDIPFIVDLYDQFEAYPATRFLGITSCFRQAVSKADGVCCVSERLHQWAVSLRPGDAKTVVIANAVNSDLFRRFNKMECRRRFNLPSDALLVGTAGALNKDRDIETLYNAFLKYSQKHPDAYLVVAGPRDHPPPVHDRICDLGLLPHADVGRLFSALDIGVVCNANSQFAHYCDPQKYLEMRACGLITIMANSVNTSLDTKPSNHLAYQPGNIDSMARSLDAASENCRAPHDISIDVPNWSYCILYCC